MESIVNEEDLINGSNEVITDDQEGTADDEDVQSIQNKEGTRSIQNDDTPPSQLAVEIDHASFASIKSPSATNTSQQEPVHYIDERTKVNQRKDELEALRKRNSLQQKKAAFKSDSPLSTSLASFFLQQKQMKNEVRKNRQGALSSLNQYRLKDSDGILASNPRTPKRDSLSSSSSTSRVGFGSMPSAYSSMADIDHFFRKQKQIDLEWREKKENTLKKLHMYRQANVHIINNNSNKNNHNEAKKSEAAAAAADDQDDCQKTDEEEQPTETEAGANIPTTTTATSSDNEVFSSLLMVHAELGQIFTALSTPSHDGSGEVLKGRTSLDSSKERLPEEVLAPNAAINNEEQASADEKVVVEPSTECSKDATGERTDEESSPEQQAPEEEDTVTDPCCRCEILDAMHEALLSKTTASMGKAEVKDGGEDRSQGDTLSCTTECDELPTEDPKTPGNADFEKNVNLEIAQIDEDVVRDEIEATLELPQLAISDGIPTLEQEEPNNVDNVDKQAAAVAEEGGSGSEARELNANCTVENIEGETVEQPQEPSAEDCSELQPIEKDDPELESDKPEDPSTEDTPELEPSATDDPELEQENKNDNAEAMTTLVDFLALEPSATDESELEHENQNDNTKAMTTLSEAKDDDDDDDSQECIPEEAEQQQQEGTTDAVEDPCEPIIVMKDELEPNGNDSNQEADNDCMADHHASEEKKEEGMEVFLDMAVGNGLELLDPFSEARHSFDHSELAGTHGSSTITGKKSCPLGLHEGSFVSLEELVSSGPVSSPMPTVDSSVSSIGSSIEEGTGVVGRLSRQTSASSLSSFWQQCLTMEEYNEALLCSATEQYLPNLHTSKGPCERCFSLASVEDRAKFKSEGRNLHIMLVRGGCRRSCTAFPRSEDQPPVRLCRKCYFDTHRAAKIN